MEELMRRKNNVVGFLPRNKDRKKVLSSEGRKETISSQISSQDDDLVS